MTFQTWATNVPERQPDHFVFPCEHYGLAGNDRKPHAKTMEPNMPVGEIKTAWEAAKQQASVQCRFHDLRHTACTRLLERGVILARRGIDHGLERQHHGQDGEALRPHRFRGAARRARGAGRGAPAEQADRPTGKRSSSQFTPEFMKGGHKIGHSDTDPSVTVAVSCC